MDKISPFITEQQLSYSELTRKIFLLQLESTNILAKEKDIPWKERENFHLIQLRNYFYKLFFG